MATDLKTATLAVGVDLDAGSTIVQGLAASGHALVVEDGGTGEHCDPPPSAGIARNIVKNGGRAVAAAHDLTSATGAAEAVALTAETFGSLDSVVLCGGLARERAFLRVDDGPLRSLIDHHLATVFLTFQAASRWMTDHRRPGRLLCVTATAGSSSGDFGRVHLAAATGGVYAAVRAMAHELRPKQITVNSIALPLRSPKATDGEWLAGGSLVHSPADLCPLVEFLLSENAAEITGQVIALEGQKVSVIRNLQSAGALPEEETWTTAEIGRRWREISR